MSMIRWYPQNASSGLRHGANGASHIISLCYVHTKLLGSCPNKMYNIASGAKRKLLGPQCSLQENGSDSDSDSGSSESSSLEIAFRYVSITVPLLGFLFGALQMGKLPSGNLTELLKMDSSQWVFPLKIVIFHSYVSFPEGKNKRMNRDQLWHHPRTSAPVGGEPRLWEEKEKESEKRKEEEPWRIVALLYKNLLSKWHHTARIS